MNDQTQGPADKPVPATTDVHDAPTEPLPAAPAAAGAPRPAAHTIHLSRHGAIALAAAGVLVFGAFTFGVGWHARGAVFRFAGPGRPGMMQSQVPGGMGMGRGQDFGAPGYGDGQFDGRGRGFGRPGGMRGPGGGWRSDDATQAPTP